MRVLLVCTGNTCRSAMAEAMLRLALAGHGAGSITVSSAGTGAWDGAPVSEGAYLVGLERGLDLSGHRAALLTREMVAGADLVLTMARHHRARVEELGGGEKTYLLGEYAGQSGPAAEVIDPFGGALQVYRDTIEQLEQLISAIVIRLEKEGLGGRR